MTLRQRYHEWRDRRLAARGYLRATKIDALLRDEWGADPMSDDEWSDRSVSYSTSVWVYRCTNVIAESLALVPLLLKQRNRDGTIGTVADHPATALLDYQHAGNLHADLWELAGIDLGLAGNHLWALERNSRGVPVEIHRLHPRVVTPHKHKWKYVDYYAYKPDPAKEAVKIPAADVVHFLYTNPDNLTWGLAPWRAAGEAIHTDLDAQKFNRSLLRDHAIPRYALTTDKHLDPTAGKAVARYWAQQLRGANRAGRVPLLHSGLKVEQLTLTHEEMQWIEQRKVSRREIRVGYGVPPWMAGDPDDATDGTPQEQMLLFWDGTMATLCRKRDTQATREYLSQFPRTAGMWLESDLSMIPCIADREQSRARERNKEHWSALEAMARTINEVREVEGLAPVPWGDAPWMPQYRLQWRPGYTGEVGDGQRALPDRSAGDDEPTGRERGGEWHTAVMERFAQRAASIEPAFAKVMTSAFERQRVATMERLQSMFGERGQRAPADNVFVPLDETARRAAEQQLTDALREGADNAENTYEAVAAFDIAADPAALEWVAKRAGVLIKEIDNTTLAAVRKTLGEGIAEGETYKDLSDRIEAVFADAKRYRAMRIAITETGGAMNEGALRAYRHNGIAAKEWLSALTPTTRPEHAEAHNQIVPLNADFTLSDGTTMPRPGASGIARHDIHCYCSIAPVVEADS